jgi:lysophospholipase L1-like esterase
MGNNNLRQLVREWREGRVLRILWLGDSLTSGTSTFAGPRDWFKNLAGELGLPTRFVGSLTNQNGLLGTFDARDYGHAGVGGETTAQIAARATAEIAATDPDLVIVNGGANDASGDNLAILTANWISLLETIRDAKPGVPIVVTTRHTANNAGSLTVNGFMQAQTYGPTDAARGFDDIAVAQLYPSLAADWSAEWHPSGDGTHLNNLGYARVAGVIMKTILGPDWADIPKEPMGQINYTTVSADIDFPWGAFIQCTGGTLNLVFADGTTQSIVIGTGHPNSLLANTVLRLPVVRVKTTGTSLGTNTLSVFPLKPGAIV